MTDTPDTSDVNASAPTGDNDSSPANAETTMPRGESVWSKLNRTNRILTVVLGGIIAVFIVVLVFAAGVFVGAEPGGYDERGDAGSSEHRGDYGDGPHEYGPGEVDNTHDGDRGDHEAATDSTDADRGGQSDHSAGPETPARSGEPSPAPGSPPR